MERAVGNVNLLGPAGLAEAVGARDYIYGLINFV